MAHISKLFTCMTHVICPRQFSKLVKWSTYLWYAKGKVSDSDPDAEFDLHNLKALGLRLYGLRDTEREYICMYFHISKKPDEFLYRC